MIALGKFNTLTIDHHADQGLYLKGDDQTGDILLPNRYVTPQMHIGDEVEVFIYLDQDERLIATTEQPLAQVGQFAYLHVAWTNKYGAFLHWGLMKDLFCPFREQKQRMERDKSYIVYVKEDEASHRLMATAKGERYLSVPFAAIPSQPQQTSQQPQAPRPLLKHGDAVEALIWQKTDLGFKAIITAPSVPSGIPKEATTPSVPSGFSKEATAPSVPSGFPKEATAPSVPSGFPKEATAPSVPSGFPAGTPTYYQGQLYDNQIFQSMHTGDRVTAYVDHIRQDGKIDLTLQPTGYHHTLDFAEGLLRYLHEHDGYCDLGDKSDADLIAERFKVSKKAYKRAVGDLYRRRLITIADDGIRLTNGNASISD